MNYIFGIKIMVKLNILIPILKKSNNNMEKNIIHRLHN